MNQLSVLRRNIAKGLPCGSERFIKKLEKLTGQALQYSNVRIASPFFPCEFKTYEIWQALDDK